MPRSVRRTALAAVLILAAGPISTPMARADTTDVDFESPTYATGTIDQQDGWSSFGAAGSGCALYDHAVTSNVGQPYSYESFGDQSLRISNAVTSGCFSDQTFSKSLGNEAGEVDAQNGGFSGGARRSHFSAQWDFASTVPDAEQPGLSVVASPDRGDGARMSWVQMADTPGGVDVNFFEYKDVAPYGSLASPGDGCDTADDFQLSNVATGLDRTQPHTVRIDLDLVPGPRNDVVTVTVDGTITHTGTSWEDYFRFCTESGGGVPNDPFADASRTVDSVLFRTGGTAAPATLGQGWLIDNLTTRSFDTTALTAEPFVVDVIPGVSVNVPTVKATLTDGGLPLAGETVTFSTSAGTICSVLTDSNGVAACDASASLLDIVLDLGYTATYAGAGDIEGSTAHGTLVRIAGAGLP
jgi:hypothetical protein